MKMNYAVQEYVKKKLDSLALYSPTEGCRLGILQIGSNPSSFSYIKGKVSDCQKVHISTIYIREEAPTSTSELRQIIRNHCSYTFSRCHGIVIQLPLPLGLGSKDIQQYVPINMDVDGFVPGSPFTPCTAKGLAEFLKSRYVSELKPVEDLHVAVVGRSPVVGKAIADALVKLGSTVSILNSMTSHDIRKSIIEECDLAITCTNQIEDSNLSELIANSSCSVVDVGLGRSTDGKLHGNLTQQVVDLIDKDINRVVVSGVGGVGLLTRLALVQNVVKSNMLLDQSSSNLKEYEDMIGIL